MLKLLFITIIFYIIIQHLLDDCEETETPTKAVQEQKQELEIKSYSTTGLLEAKEDSAQKNTSTLIINEPPSILKTGIKTTKQKVKFLVDEKKANEYFANDTNKNNLPQEPTVWEFDKPNPWSKVILYEQDEYPYHFHLKIPVPSLNDYQTWKQIIPNLDFNPRTGEILIPSKEEASALALANLICINFSGQMSIENILNKNLIQISVAKARNYEVVQNKLRDQIIENLYGKSVTKIQTNFERDLASNIVKDNDIQDNNSQVDFTSEQFTDTFEHFSDQNQSGTINIEAYDGCDYSYL